MPTINDFIASNDGGAQSDILAVVGNQENAGGMCMMLSINWIINLTKPGANAPNAVWRDMRDQIQSKGGQAYLKQIGQQQVGYTTHFGPKQKMSWAQSAGELVPLATYSKLKTATLSPNGFVSAPDMGTRVAAGLGVSTTLPKTVLIIFAFQTYAHAIAATVAGTKTYVFDPNFGVLIADTAQNQTAAAALTAIHDRYGISDGIVIPVQTA
jgi:hypothetical protein